MSAASEAVARALQLHAAGRLAEAEALYRRALAEEPENIDALHFLGVIALQQGDAAQAAVLISRALSHNPANPPAHNNLGLALAAQGKAAEALHAYLDALALQPDYGDALGNLGAALKARQRDPAAEAQADEHFNRGNADGYREAVRLAPHFTAAHANLGSALAQQGRHAEAIACFRKALALDPDLAAAYFGLGISTYQLGDLASAKRALARYLASAPDDRDALMVLGELCSRTNELDEASACVERVLGQDPLAAGAHNLLANIRRNQARHREALEHYELAIRHDRNPVVAFQNLLFCMLCSGDFSPAEILTRHREFAQRFERPLLAPAAAFRNAPVPARRLKIGYVSPDFRFNVIGQYIQPILENHDRSQFEVHAYAIGPARDALSVRIASLVDGWHDADRLSDDELAARIRSDGIDVLVDLCGHGPGNRILAFARRPAPLQVNYLDYSATTGLSSMDYRLTTEYCDPRGSADRYYSEKLWRLPDSYWTYNPGARLPVSPLPRASNGYVTFGSFNLYYRITGEVLDLWARVLRAVPSSKLVILSVAAGSTRNALLDKLRRAGIASERVLSHGVVSQEKYHELIGAVDIALAPFPYNGATTVMDCLWNGLPVVARAGGETFSSRLGCAVLDAAGLSSLIGDEADDYVRIARELAADSQRLSELRRTLRERLERSPLRDFSGFTRKLEAAYRSMWQDWCTSQAR